MYPGSSGVEQRTENPRVGSSNLPPGTTFERKTLICSHSKIYIKLILYNKLRFALSARD